MLRKYLCFPHFEDTSSSRKHYSSVIEELCHHFSLDDIRKSTKNFDAKQIIGRGGFGTVYKGCLQLNGAIDCTLAIKRSGEDSAYGSEEFRNEIELLCQIRHPNLVSLIGFCNHKDENIIVYEYISNGSLFDHLSPSNVEPLSWKKRLEICIGVAHGLHYLHTGTKRTIFHRHIKPSNILLDNNMVPKLIAFGLSLLGPQSMSKPKPIQVEYISGTYGYMAPEYRLEGIYTDKCDIYSFGMVLLHVVCARDGKTIQKRLPIEEIIDPILTGKIAPKCWRVFIDITETCLKYDPNERPSIGEVELELEHALSLQEEEDVRNTSSDHIIISKTILKE